MFITQKRFDSKVKDLRLEIEWNECVCKYLRSMNAELLDKHKRLLDHLGLKETVVQESAHVIIEKKFVEAPNE